MTRAVVTAFAVCVVWVKAVCSVLTCLYGGRYDAALEKAKYAALAMKQQAEEEVIGQCS